MFVSKNYRRAPELITAKLTTIKSTSVIATCARKPSKTEIEAGKFAYLGISLKNGDSQNAKSVMPRYDVGRTSKKIKAEGQNIIREDLPMVTNSFLVGDHDVYQWEHVSASENLAEVWH